jgi:hypothetical protein
MVSDKKVLVGVGVIALIAVLFIVSKASAVTPPPPQRLPIEIYWD